MPAVTNRNCGIEVPDHEEMDHLSMIVECIADTIDDCSVNGLRSTFDVTIGKKYVVLALEGNDYRLVGDEGRPYLYPREAFKVIDKSGDDEWTMFRDSDDIAYCGPSVLILGTVFDDYFEQLASAIAIVEPYVRRARQRQRELR